MLHIQIFAVNREGRLWFIPSFKQILLYRGQLDINYCVVKKHSLTRCRSSRPHGGIVLLGHARYEAVVWLAYLYMQTSQNKIILHRPNNGSM